MKKEKIYEVANRLGWVVEFREGFGSKMAFFKTNSGIGDVFEIGVFFEELEDIPHGLYLRYDGFNEDEYSALTFLSDPDFKHSLNEIMWDTEKLKKKFSVLCDEMDRIK